MARKLTKQEKKFVEIKAETGNGTLAVREAFGIEDDNYAAVKASRLLRKDNIVKSIEERLPDDLLDRVHLEGLEATNVRFTPEGEQIKVPDFATRHKYLDTAHKLKGTYAPDKHVTVTIEAPSEQVKQLADALLQQQRGITSGGTVSEPVDSPERDKE